MILDIVIICCLILVAILMILLEIFLLPGITIAGIAGGLFAIGGIIYAYGISSLIGHITLISSTIIFIIAFAYLLRRNSFNKVALHTSIDSKQPSFDKEKIAIGAEGITRSRLAPMGQARINNIDLEVHAVNGMINEQTSIKVTHIEGNKVWVKPI